MLGEVHLTIPVGALDACVDLVLTKTSEQGPIGFDLYSPVYRIEPSLDLLAPASLTVPFDGNAAKAALFVSTRVGGFERAGGVSSAVEVSGAIRRLGALFVADGVDYLDPPDPSCTSVSVIEGRSVQPSGLALFVRVDDCEGRPLMNLGADEFELLEDGAVLSAEAQHTTLQTHGLNIFVMLAIDVSSSATEHLPLVIEGAKSFVQRLQVERALPIHVGIEVFAGGEPVVLLEPTLSYEVIESHLDQVVEQTVADPESTNLNGAIITGLERLWVNAGAFTNRNRGGGLAHSYLVVYTDGRDTAGIVTTAEALDALNTWSSDVLAVGLQTADFDLDALESLARSGLYIAEDPSVLGREFDALSARIEAQTQRLYLIGYCSPKRSGQHEVTIRTVGSSGGREGTWSFWADEFYGGCSKEMFAKDCEDSSCGGLGCGACDDRTSICDGLSRQCVPYCRALSQCVEGVTTSQGYFIDCSEEASLNTCESSCVDIESDRLNCGSCGAACQDGQVCVGGSCVCGAIVCAQPGSLKCVDTSVARENCGGCTAADRCLSNEICEQGVCTGFINLGPAGEEGWGGVVADDTHHFFVSPTGVRRVPLGGGEAVSLATGTFDWANIAEDGSYLFIVSETASGRELRRLPKSGGASVLVHSGPIMEVLAGGGFVYWLEQEAVDLIYATTIRRRPTDGGPTATLWHQEAGSSYVWDLKLANDYLYFNDSRRTLTRIPASGGIPRQLAQAVHSYAVVGDHFITGREFRPCPACYPYTRIYRYTLREAEPEVVFERAVAKVVGSDSRYVYIRTGWSGNVNDIKAYDPVTGSVSDVLTANIRETYNGRFYWEDAAGEVIIAP